MPESGPLRSPLGLRQTLLLLGAVVLALAVLIGAVVLVARLVPGVAPLPAAAWLFPGHAIVVLIVIALLLRRWGVTWSDLGFRRPTARLAHLLWQVPLLVLAAVVVQSAASLALGPAPDRSDTVRILASGGLKALVPVAAVGAVVLVPLWEEAVFRGVILGGLRRRCSAWIAVLASSAVFAAVHAVPLLLPYLFTVGVGLALLVRFHRTLWASVIAHAGLNGLVLLISLLAVAGRG